MSAVEIVEKANNNTVKRFGLTPNLRGRPPRGQSLAEIIRDKIYWPDIVAAIADLALKGDVHAATWLADRGWGKPVEPTIDLTPRQDLSSVDTAKLISLLVPDADSSSD